jgi:hypothetical protein
VRSSLPTNLSSNSAGDLLSAGENLDQNDENLGLNSPHFVCFPAGGSTTPGVDPPAGVTGAGGAESAPVPLMNSGGAAAFPPEGSSVDVAALSGA